LLRLNAGAQGFWDAIGMWDEAHGILVGDPVDGRFEIFTTADGATWTQVKGPKAESDEALFAASGTCLFLRGTREAWFVTGGPKGARVFHTQDAGETWDDANTPLRQNSATAGIYSLALTRDGRHGVAVGGDYMKADTAVQNVAISEDGGRKWTIPGGKSPGGYRSAVALIPSLNLWIATGTSGSDISRDGGVSWITFDTTAYNAMSFAADGAGWAVGPKGAIARFAPP
jgi:photosystem II stability/assembly factor-like uncharacterized protein